MVVQHNMNALSAYNKLNTNVAGLKKSSEKLSSGYRINRAGDDAAGLAISEKMRSQIRGLNQAKRNSQDGISMIQTFEGALQESHSILQRMKELAAESANGTYQTQVDRDAIQLEFNQLNDELDQIADTDFNGTVMLNGGEMADGTQQVGGKFTYVANAPRTEAAQLGKSDINTLDNNNYNATASDDLWKNLGLTSADESIELTFKYDEKTDTWSLDDASNATAIKNKANITIDKGSTGSENNGGFSVKTSTTKAAETDLAGTAPAAATEIANVVLDSSKLVNGDTVTIKFTRPENANTAPENIGMTDGSYSATASAAASVAKATMTVNGGAAAAGNFVSTNSTTAAKEMTQEAADAFNGLNGASVELIQTTGAAAATVASRDIKLTLADGSTLTLTTAQGATTAQTGTITSDSGIKYNLSFDGNGKLTVSDKYNNELISISAGALTGGDAAAADSVTEKFKIALDEAIYSDVDKASASIVGPAESTEVSKSNSNNAATAPLTYTDHLVLQTGARTKDSVDFTFAYKTEGMGDLKANLNVSSRADGLNTANLSLNTQEDANAAIDKIDNAINKVSMVRATFGATQNRLEHKVENLTTTAENLTEAESGIRDTDMAQEMLNYTKFNVLQQAAQSMLAQANQQPQSILQLLG